MDPPTYAAVRTLLRSTHVVRPSPCARAPAEDWRDAQGTERNCVPGRGPPREWPPFPTLHAPPRIAIRPPSRSLHFTRIAGQRQRRSVQFTSLSPLPPARRSPPHPIATQLRARPVRVSTDLHDRALARAPAPAGRVSLLASQQAAAACGGVHGSLGAATGPSSSSAAGAAGAGNDDAQAPHRHNHQVQPLAQAQPQPQPAAAPPQPPHQLSRYESQKRRDWNTFLQYLRNHRPPLTLARCSGAHVIEFLKYLDQFGKTKVHAAGCAYFGQPNPPAPCPCPLRQAWGSLDALIGRLRAAYEESGHAPESNPFAARAVRIYLRDVRDAQAKARGIPYEKKSRKRKQPPVAASGEAASSSAAAAREAAGDGSGGSAAEAKAAPTTTGGQGSTTAAAAAPTSTSRV